MAPSPALAKSIGSGTIKCDLGNNALNCDDFVISFQRTLRIPDDGKQYPLPPGLGHLPIYRVQDYAKKLPQKWVEEGGLFIPMYQREAMWISFGGPESWRPRAVKIGIGKINVLTGEAWSPNLFPSTQRVREGEAPVALPLEGATRAPTIDYLVAPTPQPWIDGIKAGKDFIRQFVAMPLGKGITVEGQITGKEEEGGLEIAIINPKKGKFKKPLDQGSRISGLGFDNTMKSLPALAEAPREETQMGLAAGGTLRQKIYPDPYGFDTWDQDKFATLYVHIVNSEQFEKITGAKAPETPITQKDYELYDYPWFDLYDEKSADIKPSEKLGKVHSIERGQEKPMKVKKIIKYKMPPKANPDSDASSSQGKE